MGQAGRFRVAAIPTTPHPPSRTTMPTAHRFRAPAASLPRACARWAWGLLLALGCAWAVAATPMTHEHALRSLTHAVMHERAAALARLAEIGTMADAPRVAERLRDEDAGVRRLAAAALWAIWSRPGHAATERLFQRGLAQMGEGQFAAALVTFDQVVRRRPDFAEGWNKRATVRFLMGDLEASLKDCDEVLKRNPLHFGALSGMAQIHLQRGDAVGALRAYERALQVNPNLDGGPEMLQRLEEAARRQGGSTT